MVRAQTAVVVGILAGSAFLLASLRSTAVVCVKPSYDHSENEHELSRSNAWHQAVPVVNVSVGQRILPFVLDTGSAYSIVDHSLRGELQALPGLSREPLDPIGGIWYSTPSADGDGLTLKCPAVACIDLEPVFSRLGVKAFGILGVDSLKEFAVEMDGDKGSVVFQTTSSAPEGWCVVPMIPDEFQRPCIALDINGHSRLCLLDTGALETLQVTWEDFDSELSLGGIHGPIGRCSRYRIDGEGTPSRIARCNSLGLMGHELKPCVVTEGDICHVGAYFMRRCALVVDFPNGLLYFRPNPLWGLADRTDLCGMSVSSQRSGFEVTSIAPTGVASRSGLQRGDVIEAINAKPLEGLSVVEFPRMLTFDCLRPTVLTIRRGQSLLAIALDDT